MTIEVPPGPDSRPGERIVAPGASITPRRPLGRDGSREDFRVPVGRGGSTFAAVCLGPVADRGEPLATSHSTLRALRRRGMKVKTQPEATTVAGEPGYRYSVTFRRGDLIEWKFEHAGWLFVTGLLRRPDDSPSNTIEHAEAILDSWTWIPVLAPPIAGG